MLKANVKTPKRDVLVSLLKLRINFTPCSTVSFVNFKHVITGIMSLPVYVMNSKIYHNFASFLDFHPPSRQLPVQNKNSNSVWMFKKTNEDFRINRML